jgi:hypothetical protein
MVCAVLGLYTLSWCWYRCPEIGTSSIDWAQLCRFYLKTETESSLWNIVFWNISGMVFLDKNRMMDNVQKHNIWTCFLFNLRAPATFIHTLYNTTAYAKLQKLSIQRQYTLCCKVLLKEQKLLKSSIFWETVPCSSLKVNWCSGGRCYLHFQGRRISQIRYQCEAGSSTALKMEETRSSKMLVDFQWTTWHHIPDDRTLHNYYCGNIKSFELSKLSSTFTVVVTSEPASV